MHTVAVSTPGTSHGDTRCLPRGSRGGPTLNRVRSARFSLFAPPAAAPEGSGVWRARSPHLCPRGSRCALRAAVALIRVSWWLVTLRVFSGAYRPLVCGEMSVQHLKVWLPVLSVSELESPSCALDGGSEAVSSVCDSSSRSWRCPGKPRVLRSAQFALPPLACAPRRHAWDPLPGSGS